jgi:hypothetical protein
VSISLTAKLIPILETDVVDIRIRDRVAQIISEIESGRVKGRQFALAIEDFSFDELERLSDGLIAYYTRKFR